MFDGEMASMGFNVSIESYKTQIVSSQPYPKPEEANYLVAIFSHGLQASEVLYTQILQAVADSVKPSPQVKKLAASNLGSVPGLCVRDILADYITAAVTFFTTGGQSPLLSGVSAKYKVEFKMDG
ncbi:hypothetical protein ASPWEDRAFT_619517 [Aspergillus wentii DTO 134E9]|uniref:Uncharacterized protein n=1 Tax=Aspergillus wentii DTO 134E9 TaxID=1073089 RepID=A0A1L9REN1_ASPWE|nr:uncharacterized protein ASPWEDRAFT_619517 [Aspergillus wentii DTO 134E9]KAI9933586.1 hypothetical protein MW887_008059 [Aspergillus wentii]OJJ33338.1 hypothetical protein ASPWEDRAFT_619517 [Aspergillus wentii DTO 134E9]